MTAPHLATFFERDLRKLIDEVRLYKAEEKLWALPPGISNTAGNLCLHIVGNLKHFIGATLGHTGYVRQRDLEFSTKGVPREKLIHLLEEAIQVVNLCLVQLTEKELAANFPLEKHGEVVTTEHMLLHLLTHLNYHLGQVNYHRRLVEGSLT